jgi:hypothetical protein
MVRGRGVGKGRGGMEQGRRAEWSREGVGEGNGVEEGGKGRGGMEQGWEEWGWRESMHGVGMGTKQNSCIITIILHAHVHTHTHTHTCIATIISQVAVIIVWDNPCRNSTHA